MTIWSMATIDFDQGTPSADVASPCVGVTLRNGNRSASYAANAALE